MGVAICCYVVVDSVEIGMISLGIIMAYVLIDRLIFWQGDDRQMQIEQTNDTQQGSE